MSWLFLLAMWAFALVVGCAVYAVWNRSGLDLSVRARGGPANGGSPRESLDERLLVTAPQRPPLFESDGVEVEVGLRARRGTRGPAWVGGSVAGRPVSAGAPVVTTRGWRHVEVVPAMPRGPITATGWTVHTSDPLGFFAGRRSSADAEVAIVYPTFASLTGRVEARELEASVAAPRAGAGNELFGIREYRAGDSLRRIHWRSSARHGELIVREYEPPGVRTLGIFVDPEPSDGEAADQVARIAASEAWDCIRQGGRAIAWSPGLAGSDPAKARDLWSLLDWLARYPGPRANEEPPRVSEAVMVVASAAPEVVEAMDGARRRGASVRGWIVGDAAVDVDAPLRRVGRAWPL